MSDEDILPTGISIREWVNLARADPVKYRERQVTEILLYAIGITASLKKDLFLKGGTLMALSFGSTRQTADIDLTSTADPDDLPERFESELNIGLRKAQTALGYLDLNCRVQKVKKKPYSENFGNLTSPALDVTIAHAAKGTKEQDRLNAGNAIHVVKVEISFREQVVATQELHLSNAGVSIQAYAITEVIAEKLRALLQQPRLRNKSRRQDVYDISFLLGHNPLSINQTITIHRTLIEKCRSRGFEADRYSFNEAAVKELAHKNWHTLNAELETLPEFEGCFASVSNFYSALPWD